MLPLLLLAACGGPSEPPPPPDVVLFVVDTLRADHLHLYGHERPTSPQLDALAAEGVTFDRAFAHSSWTLASTTSLLTGLYPSEHGAVRDPDDPLRFGHLDAGVPTLASLLGAAGYHTGGFVNNVFLAPEFGLSRSFEHFDYDGASGVEERSGTATVEAALDWLSGVEGPAFLWFQLMETHVPYMTPPHLRHRFTPPGEAPVPLPFIDGQGLERLMKREWVPDPGQQDYVRALYDEEVLAADEALGELVRGLRSLGRWDHTLLVFTSDHGEEFWDHGGFEHGHTLYGELLHVPLVLHGLELSPGGSRPRGQRVELPVSHADVFQTVLAAAGVQAPGGAHGMDLRELWLHPEQAGRLRPILSEDCLYGPPRVAVTLGSYRLVLNLDNRAAVLLELDEHGQSDRPAPEGERSDALARRLYQAMVDERGDAQKHPLGDATAPIDEENMEKLRSLGYVE